MKVKNAVSIMIYLLADASALYFILLLIKTGVTNIFNYFFAVLAVLLFLAGRLFDSVFWRNLPRGTKAAVITCICIGLCFFVFLEALILSGSIKHTKEDADYVVVLGCKVQGTRPSLSLQYRMNAAVEYLKEHPGAKAVLTGGQGIGEDISEGQAMYDAMTNMGIPPERLLVENQSTTTKENLEFAKAYIDPENDSVVLVTTGYHMYRAGRIARHAGYRKLQGYSAKTVWYLVPADYIREALAIIKNFLVGNL